MKKKKNEINVYSFVIYDAVLVLKAQFYVFALPLGVSNAKFSSFFAHLLQGQPRDSLIKIFPPRWKTHVHYSCPPVYAHNSAAVTQNLLSCLPRRAYDAQNAV